MEPNSFGGRGTCLFNMTNEELWKAVLGEMELFVSKANFTTWFKPTKILSCKDGSVRVSVPNGFIREWLQNKFNKQIIESVRNHQPEVKTVEYVIGTADLPVLDRERVFQDIIKEEEVMKDNNSYEIDKTTNLNNKYIFENFIVGSSNELAHAACVAVSKSPGKTYNPLFIYGGVGLGKTHLLQSVGNKVIADSKGKKVLYIPTEKLVTEVIEAIKNKTIEDVKQKYTAMDVLIIDDIQFLAGKETTQSIFFEIFNALYNKNKQIILSSDRPAKAIPATEERLRSRFEGGMMADLTLPDFEMRLAILKQKVREKNVNISDDILEYIATKIQKNIRELEGALNRIIAFTQLSNRELILKEVEGLLQAYLTTPFSRINYQAVLKAVVDFYEITPADLTKRSRRKEVVKPRQVAMFLLREDAHLSFPEIGVKLGGRDHSTVIHAYEKVKKEESENEGVKQELVLIREKIYNSFNQK